MRTSVQLALSALRHRSKAGLAGVIVILAMASLAVVTGQQVGRGSTTLIDDLAQQANVAQLVVSSPDRSTLDDIAERPEIADTSGPYAVGFPGLRQRDGSVTVRIVATGSVAATVGAPLMRGGRWIETPGEIVLDRSSAQAYGAEVGGTVVLEGVAATAELDVVGLTIDLTDCAVPQCTPGRGFVMPETLDRIAGSQQWWMLLATVDAGVDVDLLAARLDQEFGARLTGVNTWPDTRGDFLTIDRIFATFLVGFGGFLLVATAIVLAGSTGARLVQRRREIGITKTVGATGGQLVGAFLIEQLLLAAVGVTLGWIAGSVLAPQLQVGLADAVGRSAVRFGVQQLAVAGALVFAVVAVSAVVPAARAARTPAVRALRDDAVPTSALARTVSRVPAANAALGLGDLAARPLRTAFAVLVAMVAVIGTLVAAAFLSTMSRVSAEPRLGGDPWDVSIVANPSDSTTIEAALETEPSVLGWFTESSDRGIVNDTAIVARAIGGPTDGARYAIGGGRMIAAIDEAIVGHHLLGTLGIDIGDEVTVVRGGTSLSLRVVGWYRETEESGDVLVHRIEALAAAGAPVSPNVWLVLGQRGVERSDLLQTLSARLGPIASVREIELDTDLGAFRIAMMVIAGLVVVVAAMHLAATWLTSIRERARELGALRTIGCTDAQLVGQHALAGAAVATLAWMVGTPVGIGVNRVLGDLVTTSIGAGPGLTARPSVMAIVVTGVGAAAVGAALAAAIARRLLQVPTPSLVRYE